ncbi:MAG: hypothetical protein ABFC80_07030, partial [Coriobacteriales bacterium]
MDWLVAFLIGVLSGVVASVIVLVVDRRRAEKLLRHRFESLQGDYEHVNLAGEPVPNGSDVAMTTLRYVGNATFDVSADTRRGRWSGHIKMDPILPDHGTGTFTYEDPKLGNGTIQVVVI